jgi:hypothetical protein
MSPSTPEEQNREKAGAVTTNVYDERDHLIETDAQFDRTRIGDTREQPKPKLLVSKCEYDAAGNRITEFNRRNGSSGAARQSTPRTLTGAAGASNAAQLGVTANVSNASGGRS